MKHMGKRLKWIAVVALAVSPLIWGCSSSDGPVAPTQITVERQERTGPNCLAGGMKTLTGLDTNSNGELDIAEIDATQTTYSCYSYTSTDVVATTAGNLQGIQNSSVKIFKGIPFAKPPVDAQRWKAPQDPDAWTDTLQVTESKSICTQGEMDTTWHASGQIIGSEDCLYLDLYRPNSDETDLPVYIYFHGGANRFGGAAAYDGSYLAEDQNIIVIFAQYRLGPLGWLTSPDLRAEDPADTESSSGNFGTLDNIKALEWIQANIANFGGDANSVTIAGQSAGASNVAKLLISPLAAGLFDKAILQSLGGSIDTQATGDDRSAAMLTALGYDAAVDGTDIPAYLRSKTAAELIAAHGTTFGGFADGTVLPAGYVETIYNESHNDVPIMIGSTEYEFKNFLPLYAPLYSKPLWGNVYDLFDANFDETKQWTFDEIFPTQADIDLYEEIGRVRSLGWKSKSVDELAAVLTEHQSSNVYAYWFKWGGTSSTSAEFAHIFGAFHAMDISFFFGYDETLFGYALTSTNRDGFESLQEVMMDYLGNFVRAGDPNSTGLTEWTQWSNSTAADAPKCIILDADTQTAQVSMDTERIMPQDMPAIAQAAVDGWSDPAGIAIISGIPAYYPPEYLYNDEGHELLYADLAFTALTGATGYSGVTEQAGFQIEVPDGWTAGDSDLLLYAHGYRSPATYGNTLVVSQPSRLRAHLISEGMAWAASSYTANNYNIISGVESTADLLAYFKATFGEPRRVYIVGHSMGGHITAKLVADSDYKGEFAGAMPMCGVVGGAPDLFSYHLDWGLVSSYYAGSPLDSYVPPYTTTQLGELQTAITVDDALGTYPDPTALNAAGENFKAAMMYRTGGNRPMFDAAFAQWGGFMLSTTATGLLDPTRGLGLGNVSGNQSTVYRLDMDDATDTAAETALNAGVARVADPNEMVIDPFTMWSVSGDIAIPVLSLHNIGDLYVPLFMEQVWKEKIDALGNDDLFRVRVIRAVDHCDFTVTEEVTAFTDLVNWVENSVTPGGDDIATPATVAASDFGCTYTSEGRSNDTDYATVCAP